MLRRPTVEYPSPRPTCGSAPGACRIAFGPQPNQQPLDTTSNLKTVAISVNHLRGREGSRVGFAPQRGNAEVQHCTALLAARRGNSRGWEGRKALARCLARSLAAGRSRVDCAAEAVRRGRSGGKRNEARPGETTAPCGLTHAQSTAPLSLLPAVHCAEEVLS